MGSKDDVVDEEVREAGWRRVAVAISAPLLDRDEWLLSLADDKRAGTSLRGCELIEPERSRGESAMPRNDDLQLNAQFDPRRCEFFTGWTDLTCQDREGFRSRGGESQCQCVCRRELVVSVRLNRDQRDFEIKSENGLPGIKNGRGSGEKALGFSCCG